MREPNDTLPPGPTELGLASLQLRLTSDDHPERPRLALLDNPEKFRAAVYAAWFSWSAPMPPHAFIHDPDLFRAQDSPIRRLNAYERRQIRLYPCELKDVIAWPGVMYAASYRLSLMQYRQKDEPLAGHEAAVCLQEVYVSDSPESLRYAWGGWEIIRVLDAVGYVPAYLESGQRLRERLTGS